MKTLLITLLSIALFSCAKEEIFELDKSLVSYKLKYDAKRDTATRSLCDNVDCSANPNDECCVVTSIFDAPSISVVDFESGFIIELIAGGKDLTNVSLIGLYNGEYRIVASFKFLAKGTTVKVTDTLDWIE